MEFFRLASFMWTGCFAVHLYQIIWKNIKDPEVCFVLTAISYDIKLSVYVFVCVLLYHLLGV
jgi:hypothetical protein